MAQNKARSAGKKAAPELAHYQDKSVTQVIHDFADWIEKNVGLELDDEARQILFIGSALRPMFQKSDDNQKRIADRKAEIEREAQERAERAKERAAKKSEPKAKAAPKVEKTKAAPKAKVEKNSAPAAKSAGKTKAAAPARRRPAKVSQSEEF